jgi:hypothetical protein
MVMKVYTELKCVESCRIIFNVVMKKAGIKIKFSCMELFDERTIFH